MRFLRPIRVRLTLWYVLLLALTLALFCAGVYFALRESLYSNLDDSIEGRAELIAGLVATDGGVDVEGVEIPGDPVEGEEYVRVFDDRGDVVFDNASEEFLPPEDTAAVAAALSGDTRWRTIDAGGVELRVLTMPVGPADATGAVEVGLATQDVDETLNTLLVVIVIAYPLAVIAAGAGGLFLAGRALAPIDTVTRAAQRISASDLSERLELDLPDDEVGRLARTFDGMIARLDDSFRRQRQFTSDASHELRTPLTAIKGQAEVALQRERTPDEYRRVLTSVNHDVDRMIRLVRTLLTLARADASQIPIAKGPMDVGSMVTGAVDQMRPIAAEKGIALTVDGSESIVIRADEDLVLQLVLNLLDNAVRYTPAGGAVEASCRVSGPWVEITVSDTGVGIPPEHLSHIFERFYRADTSRSREDGGAGLGLSICKWVADAHGGTIEATSRPGAGSRFTVRLPLSSSA